MKLLANLHQYSKRLAKSTATPDSVSVSFADGTSATGTLLIGADGARSSTRLSIYGASAGAATPLPYKAINMHVTYNDAAVARKVRAAFVDNKILALAFHPQGYWLWASVQGASDESRPETWVFQLQWTWAFSNHSAISSSPSSSASVSDPANDKVQLEQLKRVAAREFAEPWRTAWTAIPDGTPVYENSISTWMPAAVPAEGGFCGKACLAGDAAHAMSFHRGQGLNHGIADAASIVKELKQVAAGEKGLADAVVEYENEMIARAGEEVKMGKMNTEMVHDWPKLMESPFMKMGGAKSS